MDHCPICSDTITFFPDENGRDIYDITCHQRCGSFILTRHALVNLKNTQLSLRKIANLSGYICENQGIEIDAKKLENLLQLPSPSFHEKADKILLSLEIKSEYAGARITKTPKFQSIGWCANHEEFNEIINYLKSTHKIIEENTTTNRFYKILPEGWAHLEHLKSVNLKSSQCFVAMWFDPEMDQVFEDAIKPAVEFIEYEHDKPRFKALKINNVEHINDINDEIIGQIRRSRFMVCDLTGYRGGVYFEAGFAYGLGLDVIYTCREDWTKDETLQNESGESVEYLFTKDKTRIPIKKEGVHFDLAHRNRIEWSLDNLPDFKDKLEKRIKSVIQINNNK